MDNKLYLDAQEIINYSIKKVLPGNAVRNALRNYQEPKGKTIMIAIGKAAFTMAEETLKSIKIDQGLVITKYGHSKGFLKNTEIIEAGHPLLDNNSIIAANRAIELCNNLSEEDNVIMLISGGGSALFEAPLISLDELQEINSKLLKCGANINEINTIRKRLSKVKGGRFAMICKPAKIINIVLSDIINDPLDMIASGPTYPDNSSTTDVLNIIDKYHLELSEQIIELLKKEPVKHLDNIKTFITGNNTELKKAAIIKAKELGYETICIDKAIVDDVNNAVKLMIAQIKNYRNNNKSVAIIAGGEITVQVKGDGLGGRNQEFALRCAEYLKDKDACVFAIGSDGTDGPTDAAGGYVDKYSYHDDIDTYLNNNDAYHYFEKYGGLIKTGPTGTNVCDLYCALIK